MFRRIRLSRAARDLAHKLANSLEVSPASAIEIALCFYLKNTGNVAYSALHVPITKNASKMESQTVEKVDENQGAYEGW
jgi:hypothetical protein